MRKEEARMFMLDNATKVLTHAKDGKSYLCPICGSGSGKNGTGITPYSKDNGRTFSCWAKGCFRRKNIIQIIGLKYGLTEWDDMFAKACEVFGISIDSQDAEKDFSDYYLLANKNIMATQYHRGLSLDTLNRFQVGFVQEWRHPKAPKMKPSPRLIVPTSRYSYLARYAGEGDYINYKGKIENKSKVGKVRIFNRQALKTSDKPIFVVEGEIDAMSICDVGAVAIGLGSLSNADEFLRVMKLTHTEKPFILSLDNEKEPEKQANVQGVQNKIAEGLRSLGVSCYTGYNVALSCKDANEALMKDRQSFMSEIQRIVGEVEAKETERIEAEKNALKSEATAFYLQDFVKNIEESAKNQCYSTGFAELDKILDGGLYAGLYTIGAGSSVGKTTLSLQIGDNVADSGHDVLIFSLEMARNELIAKSVSRLTLLRDFTDNASTEHAKTTRDILTGKRYKYYTDTERKLIRDAIEDYKGYAENIYITEGVGDIGIDAIRDRVTRHIRLTGKKPLVIVDYLQILAPADIRASDKQNTDKAVLELKRLSRDYSIPVLCISSFNRMSYTSPVNMASFKESGAIEYSADVLIGIQYKGMDYDEDETDSERTRRIRELVSDNEAKGKIGESLYMQVKVLKNRNGCKGSALLKFYPRFNYFQDANESDLETNDENSQVQRTRKPYKSRRTLSRKQQKEADDLFNGV
jgi:replicative DNA helicase